MRRRIRVLHTVLDLEAGGLESLVADMVRETDHDQFELHVLCLSHPGRQAEGLSDYARLHVAPPAEPWSLVYPRRLSRMVKGISPDVLHTHSGVWLKSALAARLAGVPRVVYTDHGRITSDPIHLRLVDGAAARLTDVAVAVSRPLQEYLKRRIVPASVPVILIPNGVAVTRFRPDSRNGLRRELGIPSDRPLIGSIGRLDPIKGYDIAIRAMAELRIIAPETDPLLVIVGEGPHRPALEKLVRELDVMDCVRFVGWRDNPEQVYPGLDIFTLTSRSEGTSVSLLEAMSCGTCPVVTDVGGNRWVLGPDLAHRLVPSENPAAIARGWQAALLDESSRQADARRARSRVESEFSFETMVRHYEALYRGEDYLLR